MSVLDTEYNEPHLLARLEKAKAKAKSLYEHKDHTDSGMAIALRWIICRNTGTKLFDSYFEKLTFDELAIEAHMWLSRETDMVTPKEDKVRLDVATAVKEKPEEMMELFDGLPGMEALS